MSVTSRLSCIGLHRVLSSACCSFNHDTAQQQLFGGEKQQKECVLGSSMLGEYRVIDSWVALERILAEGRQGKIEEFSAWLSHKPQTH